MGDGVWSIGTGEGKVEVREGHNGEEEGAGDNSTIL